MQKNVNIQGLKIHCDTYNLFLKHPAFFLTRVLYTLDILFPSNHNIHKSSHSLCFWATDPLIDKFYLDLSIKGSDAQKQRPHELL